MQKICIIAEGRLKTGNFGKYGNNNLQLYLSCVQIRLGAQMIFQAFYINNLKPLIKFLRKVMCCSVLGVAAGFC